MRMISNMIKTYMMRLHDGYFKEELLKYGVDIMNSEGRVKDGLWVLYFEIIPTLEIMYFKDRNLIQFFYLIDLIIGLRNRNNFIKIFLPNIAEDLWIVKE